MEVVSELTTEEERTNTLLTQNVGSLDNTEVITDES